MTDKLWLKWFFVFFYLIMGVLLLMGHSMIVMAMMAVGMLLESLDSLIETYLNREPKETSGLQKRHQA